MTTLLSLMVLGDSGFIGNAFPRSEPKCKVALDPSNAYVDCVMWEHERIKKLEAVVIALRLIAWKLRSCTLRIGSESAVTAQTVTATTALLPDAIPAPTPKVTASSVPAPVGKGVMEGTVSIEPPSPRSILYWDEHQQEFPRHHDIGQGPPVWQRGCWRASPGIPGRHAGSLLR